MDGKLKKLLNKEIIDEKIRVLEYFETKARLWVDSCFEDTVDIDELEVIGNTVWENLEKGKTELTLELLTKVLKLNQYAGGISNRELVEVYDEIINGELSEEIEEVIQCQIEEAEDDVVYHWERTKYGYMED